MVGFYGCKKVGATDVKDDVDMFPRVFYMSLLEPICWNFVKACRSALVFNSKAERPAACCFSLVQALAQYKTWRDNQRNLGLRSCRDTSACCLQKQTEN